MKVLVVGSGGREHAILHNEGEPADCEALRRAGNGGISRIAECVNIRADDTGGIVRFSGKWGSDSWWWPPTIRWLSGWWTRWKRPASGFRPRCRRRRD